VTATRTHAELVAELTAPGQQFEIVRADVLGHDLPVYRNAPPHLRAVFERSEAFGPRPFCRYRETRWTYAEHGARVRRLAAFLVDELGVAQGDRVAIGMRNYPEWLVSFWAVQSIGAVAVPLNAWWTGPELQYALRDSGTTVAILDDERLDRLEDVLPELVRSTLVVRARGDVPSWVRHVEDVIEVEGAPPALPAVEIAPDDPSTIMYTSGTTGNPKGAVQTHRNHCTNLMNTAFAAAYAAAGADPATVAEPPLAPPPDQSTSVSLQTFPFFHIGGMSGLYISTAFGATFVLMYKWDPEEAVRLVVDEGVTTMAGVPTVVRQLIDELDRQGVVAPGLTSISSGGAPVPPSLIDRIGERSGRAVRPANGYGLTETTSAVVSNAGADYYDHPDSVGRPVPVAEVSIRDEQGNPVLDGVTGELWVRGPNVVNGYWNNPEATAAAFTDGWFHSGDAAYVHDGFVHVVDRIKDVVLRGGENVYCAEVEAAIHAIDGVVDVAVVGMPHEVLGEEVAAVVELVPGATLDGAELRRQVAARLAAFKVPSRLFLATEPLPRTATGKLLKRDIRTAIVTEGGPYAPLDAPS
jgi:acyl-CoA synthetase (AMP-forming)/AMP-acid ligase II